MVVVATAVSAIPEGLPVAVTITMAIGVARMARRNAIIRKLPAVETLGSTTVICSDKTGTLTKNEMTVRLIYDGEHIYDVTGSGYEPKGEILHDQMSVKSEEKERHLQVLRIGLLCNESNMYEEDGQYKVDGDPTEGAIVVAAAKAGLNKDDAQKLYPRVAEVPFDSGRKRMTTIHKNENNYYSRAARGDAAGAIDAYRTAVDRYPEGNKIPDALLKLGVALDATGQRGAAREIWAELVRRFPTTAAAVAAALRLEAP